MSEASHRVMIHENAQRELDALARDYDVEDLTGRIKDAAACRQPKTHPTVSALSGYPGMVYVKGDGLRAICELVKPEFRVLLVDKRRVVYDRIETAVRRADDDAGGAF